MSAKNSAEQSSSNNEQRPSPEEAVDILKDHFAKHVAVATAMDVVLEAQVTDAENDRHDAFERIRAEDLLMTAAGDDLKLTAEGRVRGVQGVYAMFRQLLPDETKSKITHPE